ncbi:MAG: M23 family metallopeptidase [Sphingorhabdus sp.]
MSDYEVAGHSQAPGLPDNVRQIVPEQTIITDTPTWSPAVVERNARPAKSGDYVVQPGDTLLGIESKTGAGLMQIAIANTLLAPYVLRVGQRLAIPGGIYHRVGEGETGIAIARAYSVPWAEIVNLNDLQHPYLLRPGQRLRLPGVPDALPPGADLTLEQRALAFSLQIDDIVTGSEPATGKVPSAGSIARPLSFDGAFSWPLSGSILARFGNQGGGKVNNGLNIATLNGNEVAAAAAGTIVYSGNEIGVFGGLVLIDHGEGWITAYGHLGRLDVVRGQQVAVGQTLGTVGETGYVTRPQLHFEIRKDRKPLDPLTILPTR